MNIRSRRFYFSLNFSKVDQKVLQVVFSLYRATLCTEFHISKTSPAEQNGSGQDGETDRKTAIHYTPTLETRHYNKQIKRSIQRINLN